VVSGTLVSRSPLDEDDDEINGLLSRLKEETPTPEFIGDLEDDTDGTWLVSRPGQKERPFDRSGAIPVAVPREEAGRRHITPPQLDLSALPTTPAPPTFVPRSQHKTTLPRAAAQTPPAGPPVTVRRPTPPPPGLASRTPSGQHPVVVKPPSGTHPVVRPTPLGPPARGPAPAVRPQPLPPRTPVGPPVAPRLPVLGVPVMPRPPIVAPTARTGVASRPPSVQAPPAPRRISTPGESVVVARPAVVIGAPPTVIGAEQSSAHRRPHGREPTAPILPADNIFGQDLISEKSLDEVIMAYLSEDASED
jgi:hypothetical protein